MKPYYHYTLLLLAVFLITACSGSKSSETPAAVPTATVTGTALDGLIISGTITAYDFTGGVKGRELGRSVTNSKGLYSLSLQSESRPVLLEVTGGFYIEEMMPGTNINLDTSDKLVALLNFTTGQSLNVSVTSYTTLATGLAQYQIAKGTDVPTAINDANSRISQLIGANILTTTPLEITDVANASASMTPGLQYGFLAGGISMWVFQHQPAGMPSGTAAIVQPYTSIKFVRSLYQDIVADGLLNGAGKDASGNPLSLSFGNTPLGTDVYRRQIAVAMMQMANDINNRTGLDAAKVLNFAKSYAASTDPMFNGITPVAIESPIVTMIAPSSGAWVRGVVNVTASVQDYAGVSNDSVAVDNVIVSTVTPNLIAPSFPIITTNYSDGPHTITLTATNIVGMSTAVATPVKVDNTPPTVGPVTISGSASPGGTNTVTCNVSGTVTDSMSGPTASLDASWGSGASSSAIINGAYSFNATLPMMAPSYPALSLVARDVAGNASSRSYSMVLYCSAQGGRGSCGVYSCALQ